jgi:hypothetical protein
MGEMGGGRRREGGKRRTSSIVPLALLAELGEVMVASPFPSGAGCGKGWVREHEHA